MPARACASGASCCAEPPTCFRAVPNKGEPISPTFVEGPNRCVQHLLFVMAIPTKVTGPNLYRAGALLLLTASVLGPATSGEAHDWYPAECCHAMDCAPVESWAFAQTVQSGSLPQISVTTKQGTAIVPQNLPRRASKDNRMHACMRAGAMGVKHIICIFFPPGT